MFQETQAGDDDGVEDGCDVFVDDRQSVGDEELVRTSIAEERGDEESSEQDSSQTLHHASESISAGSDTNRVALVEDSSENVDSETAEVFDDVVSVGLSQTTDVVVEPDSTGVVSSEEATSSSVLVSSEVGMVPSQVSLPTSEETHASVAVTSYSQTVVVPEKPVSEVMVTFSVTPQVMETQTITEQRPPLQQSPAAVSVGTVPDHVTDHPQPEPSELKEQSDASLRLPEKLPSTTQQKLVVQTTGEIVIRASHDHVIDSYPQEQTVLIEKQRGLITVSTGKPPVAKKTRPVLQAASEILACTSHDKVTVSLPPQRTELQGKQYDKLDHTISSSEKPGVVIANSERLQQGHMTRVRSADLAAAPGKTVHKLSVRSEGNRGCSEAAESHSVMIQPPYEDSRGVATTASNMTVNAAENSPEKKARNPSQKLVTDTENRSSNNTADFHTNDLRESMSSSSLMSASIASSASSLAAETNSEAEGDMGTDVPSVRVLKVSDRVKAFERLSVRHSVPKSGDESKKVVGKSKHNQFSSSNGH